MVTTVITDVQPIALPFTNIDMTESINNLPSTFGQMEAEGFFPVEGMPSQYVSVHSEDGVISALPVTDPEGPSTIGTRDTGAERIFRIPNISHLQAIMANDVRGILEAGRGSGARTMESEMNKWLGRLRKKFDITLELQRISALKGQIVDGAGRILYDLFQAFEVAQTTIFFDLANPAADIQAKCEAVTDTIETNLSDEVMTGVEARVSASFFTALINHPNVNKFWLQTESAQALANIATFMDDQYTPRFFRFGNIKFIEYKPLIPMWGGGSIRAISAGLGHAYPAGTMDSHYTYVAPPIDLRVLNGGMATTDDLVHVTTEMMKHGVGVEVKGQGNFLALWRRPKVLITLSAAAS